MRGNHADREPPRLAFYHRRKSNSVVLRDSLRGHSFDSASTKLLGFIRTESSSLSSQPFWNHPDYLNLTAHRKDYDICQPNFLLEISRRTQRVMN